MTADLSFFATTPKGLELLLVDELRALGATAVAEKLAGVTFKADLKTAYAICLWSRLANRILLNLILAPAKTPEELYHLTQQIKWDEHLNLDRTFAIHCVTSQSTITHNLFAAQKVKDAIVDQLRDQYGARPNVAKHQPDVSIYVYLHRDVATISLDLAGESLHKRGYRLQSGVAPLKENLAAAILLRANWPVIAKSGGTLLDPMCGSGTLLIEAAMMAADIAPGLGRSYFGFLGWLKHDAKIWQNLVKDAETRAQVGLKHLPIIVGYDEDPDAIAIAFENIKRANLLGKVHVEKASLDAFAPTAKQVPGLVITNPPYGERIGEVENLGPLYTLLGERLKAAFVGWQAAVFTGNPELGKQMGLRAKRSYALFNGAIPCKLLLFSVEQSYFVDRSIEADNARLVRAAERAITDKQHTALQMFVNRLQKNLKHLQRRANKAGTNEFRVYDKDLPDYAFAIDIKSDCVYVREYKAPKLIAQEKVLRRRQEVLAVLPEILNVSPRQIFFEVLSED